MSRVRIPDKYDRNPGKTDNAIFAGNLADAVFSKKVMKAPLPYGWEPGDIKPKFDPYNEYTLNSYNYRGPEMSGDIDFIFLGCSQTFGVGVPDDGVWPKFVSDALKASYVNISMLGAGMEWITDSVYRYVHTFGRPKRGIMVLAPDFGRVDLMVNNSINSCPNPSIYDYVPQYYDKNNLDLRLITYHTRPNKNPVNYLKRPFSVEDTTIEEEAVRRTVKALKDLELFCEQAGIPLIWGTWSDALSELLQSLPDEYKLDNFIDTEWAPTNLDEGRATCHSTLSDVYGLAFDAGTDRFKTNDGQSHMGVHKHIHMADAFIGKALELGI